MKTAKPIALRGKPGALLQRYAQRISAAYQSVAALIVARSQQLLGQLKHASLPITTPSPRKFRIGAG